MMIRTPSLLAVPVVPSSILFCREETNTAQRNCFQIRFSGAVRGEIHLLSSSNRGAAYGQISDSERGSSHDETEENQDDEDGDELLLPFKKMKQWLQKKPRGFGLGRTYDTSIEDNLLEEIAQSRRVQAINLANLKISNQKVTQKEMQNPKAESPDFRVRLFNLPKKKNIQRDLKMAFKNVGGIVSVVPVVLGNKKTKDPICKGYAFVDFKSHANAARFADQFSDQIISFGKINKRIKCQLLDSSQEDKESLSSEIGTKVSPARITSVLPEVFFDDQDEFDDDEEFIEAEFRSATDVVELAATSELNTNANEQTKVPTQKKVTKKKKMASESTKQNLKELDIPGSARRLKIKEKAMLSGVFSKYSSQATSQDS